MHARARRRLSRGIKKKGTALLKKLHRLFAARGRAWGGRVGRARVGRATSRSAKRLTQYDHTQQPGHGAWHDDPTARGVLVAAGATAIEAVGGSVDMTMPEVVGGGGASAMY